LSLVAAEANTDVKAEAKTEAKTEVKADVKAEATAASAASDDASASEVSAPANKWPREIKVSNALITVYQPQLEEVDKNRIKAVAAVGVKRDNRENTDYCAVWMTAKLKVDKDERVVSMADLKVDKISYPGVSDNVKDSLGGIIKRHLLKADLTMSLDRLVAMMATLEKKEKAGKASDLKNPVPKFFFSKEPAVLVTIQGDPVMRDQGNGVSIVANTPFYIALDTESKKYYLKCAGRWFESDKLETGWKAVAAAPEKVAGLAPKEEESKEDAAKDVDGPAPKIFVSTEPAELIQCDGEPELGKIVGANLSYLKNSDSDIFRDEDTGKLYVLASGRWYVADKKEGPWSYISSKDLPEDFRKIPGTSPKANVLVSIEGTEEAKEAVAESFIPQTAELKRKPVNLGIEYDGEPDFQKLEGTSLDYAVNADTPVVRLNGKFYACSDGAWYESDSPKDPWTVCVKVPDEIYEIPPSSPLYNTTFVKVYDYDEDNDIVDVGYTPGYLGSYVYGGCVVFGTGWLCHRYLWRRWLYCHRPHILPIPTFGAICRYNLYRGCWNRYARYRLGNGKYMPWRRQPRSALAGRRRPSLPMAPGKYVGRQPRTAPVNAYARNKAAVKTAILKRGMSRESAVKAAAVARASAAKRARPNNVYVGKDGKVYRHSLNGWQKRNNGKWGSVRPSRPATKPATRPTTRPVTRPTRPTTRPVTRPTRPVTRPTRPVTRPTRPSTRPSTRPYTRDLNRYYKSRQRGNYRSSRYRSSRRSYSRGRSSVRRSGGVRRGGGGRRR
jgi:hypothetical protein